MIWSPPAFAQARLVRASSEETQLRTDSVKVTRRARDLQASFERRRRQMLPKFYAGAAEHCLIVGRFCEWHPNLKEDVVPGEGKKIANARAQLLWTSKRHRPRFRETIG